MNAVVLIGSETAVANFTLAVDRPLSKDKTADFIRIVCFGKTAELCERYLAKGRMVGVQGRIQTGSYKDKNGETRYTTEVYADRVEFLDWGEKGGSKGAPSEGAPSRPSPGIPEGFQALEEDDDDIPF